MNIEDIFDLAASIGYLPKYFKNELVNEDFWDLSSDGYMILNDEEKQQEWFIINPEKLNKNVLLDGCVFIVSEKQKSSLLKAFKILKNYSKGLPEDASFKERILVTKKALPPVFFSSEDDEIKEGKLIPFAFNKN